MADEKEPEKKPDEEPEKKPDSDKKTEKPKVEKDNRNKVKDYKNYFAKWGPKGFLTSPKKVVPFWDLKTSFAMKKGNNKDTSETEPTNTAGRDAQRITFRTRYAKAAGMDPKGQMSEWYKLVGEKWPFYIGGVQFGPPLLQLENVKYSNFEYAHDGTIISVDAEIHLVEWYEGIELHQGWVHPKVENGFDGEFSGSTNEERIWSFLRSHGFSAAAAAGVMGSMVAESECKPDSEEIPNGYGTHGYGLAQWTGPRRTDLFNWCAKRGKNVKSLEAQLEFLIYEYDTYYGQKIKNETGLDYKKITDVWTATDVWLSKYEGCTVRTEIVHWDRRINAAKAFYAKWKNVTSFGPSGRPGGGIPGNGKCPPAMWNAIKNTGWPGPDRCATWASAVYQKVIGIHPNLDGCGYATRYGRSSNLSTLRPGMMMACEHSPWSYRYGHVAIYVGNNQVYSSERGGVIVRGVQEFINMYGPKNGGSTVLWGWVEGRVLS